MIYFILMFMGAIASLTWVSRIFRPHDLPITLVKWYDRIALIVSLLVGSMWLIYYNFGNVDPPEIYHAMAAVFYFLFTLTTLVCQLAGILFRTPILNYIQRRRRN